MPRRRYQRPSGGYSDDETLPLDTQLTILTRQSTLKQKGQHVYSQERNPQELVAEGQRLGFTNIKVYDWDTGIGAYKTTIADRPALRHWLYELLPSEVSRVLLVSQVDRLFRDKWETEHNAFIRQVATHGGWVICGGRVYNFRRDMDCEEFRFHCKYGKQYVVDHIIRRMLPALHRSAMAGRYPGGAVAWGYVVDYEKHSATYKRLVRYEPHAVLVIEHLFRRFSRMLQPAPMELARQWECEGLVFPFFGAEVDERRVRWADAHCRRDQERGGYPLHFKTAQRILTDVAYLGWRVRSGEVALDEAGKPRLCHEPLVDADLFWWCYDHILPERPEWAPIKTVQVAARYRPRLLQTQRHPGEVRSLTPGRMRCAVHDHPLTAVKGRRGHVELHCGRADQADFVPCARVYAAPVDDAVARAFLELLVLDERDVAALAKVAQERAQRNQGAVVGELQRQLDEQQQRYERARRLALTAPDLADDVLDELRRAKRAVQQLEGRVLEAREATVPSSEAWQVAQCAVVWAERIRETFLRWPREAQARVILLALEDAALGWVSRHVLGVWLRWHGGTESRREVVSPRGRHVEWTTEEVAALHGWYEALTWDALCRMFPGRSARAIEQQANRMGLRRASTRATLSVPPFTFAEPPTPNVMVRYGFPLKSAAAGRNSSGAASQTANIHTGDLVGRPA